MYARSILALNNRALGLYLDEPLQDEYDAMLRSTLQDNRRMKGCLGAFGALMDQRADRSPSVRKILRVSKFLSASSPYLAMTSSDCVPGHS
jgi:hypothetical protein